MITWISKRIVQLLSSFSCGLLFLALTTGSIAAQISSDATLNAYALRGPQDATAKLYLSTSATSGDVPQQFDSVRVSLTGPDGQPQNATTYRQVAAPGGQAVTVLRGELSASTGRR